MKTIDERAYQYIYNQWISCRKDCVTWGDIEEGYRIGATEQKAIDDKRIAELEDKLDQTSCYEEGFEEGYTAAKKEVAMKAYCKRCQDMGGGYPCSHKCYEYIEYAKTLEE